MRDYYEFFCPVKIIAGNKALGHLPFEIENLGAARPMIITDKGVSAAGLIRHVENSFKNSKMVIGPLFDNVPPDSSLEIVNELASIYNKNDCDSIIAVGGGSVIDTAKGVNIVVSESSDDLMKFTGAGALKRPLKPLIVIPTTAGTGSETTLVAVIADHKKNKKMLFTSHFLMPNIAVIDTRMTLTLPPNITASTAMDALTHAVEAYVCLAKNPISDAYAIGAIKMISDNVLDVVEKPSNKKGRLMLAQASTMAGIAFSNSMVGLVHTLGHTVGALCKLPHGTAMSILLPFVLEYNLKKDKSGKVKENLSELLIFLAGTENYVKIKPQARAQKAIYYIKELKDDLFRMTGLPRTLSETGKVEYDRLEEIAKASLNDASITYNPVEVDFKDALAVLRNAF